jgi:hypothetical protein
MARTPKLSTPDELAQLASMARNRAPGLSDVTLRVQTDLLMSGGPPHPDMTEAYAALLSALLPRSEPRTIDIVLGKLASWPDLPASLARLIASYRPQHQPDVSEPIPSGAQDTQAPTAPSLPLKVGHPAMPADAASVIDPVQAHGRPVARTPELAGQSDLQQLVAQARTDKALARMLASQDDLPALALAPLFADTDLPARTRILMAVQRHLAIAPIANPPRAAIPEIAHIITLMRTEPVEAAIMIASILEGGEPLAAALVVDIDRTLTALAAIALGFEPEETVRLLIVAGDDVSRDTSRVLELAELARNIEPKVALKLVAAMTGVAVARPAGRAGFAHVPVADPSGTPARSTTSATERPARKLQWTTHLASTAKPAG